MKLGHPRTGSLGQIRQIHASDLPRQENRGQQQNLQKKRAASSKKTARARHSLTSSVGKSTGSARDTIPRQKDKRKQQRLGERDEENYQSMGKKPQKKRKVDVAGRSPSCKNLRNEKPSHSTKHVTDSLLQDELDTTTHEKQISDDVTNPFDFK